MAYDLYIGDRTFSSWSLRGWLMLEKFGLPYRIHLTGLYAGTLQSDLKAVAPARRVPAIKTPEGYTVGETMAMAETLAERHPDAQMWPQPEQQRILARWICAEMATGFSALRGSCPMQLQHVNEGFQAPQDVLTNLARIEELWSLAQQMSGPGGWLFGSYSLADVFYAPVAARIIGYDLPVSENARAYCLKTVRDPAFKAWRAEGLKVTYDPFPYPMGVPTAPWPA